MQKNEQNYQQKNLPSVQRVWKIGSTYIRNGKTVNDTIIYTTITFKLSGVHDFAFFFHFFLFISLISLVDHVLYFISYFLFGTLLSSSIHCSIIWKYIVNYDIHTFILFYLFFRRQKKIVLIYIFLGDWLNRNYTIASCTLDTDIVIKSYKQVKRFFGLSHFKNEFDGLTI